MSRNFREKGARIKQKPPNGHVLKTNILITTRAKDRTPSLSTTIKSFLKPVVSPPVAPDQDDSQFGCRDKNYFLPSAGWSMNGLGSIQAKICIDYLHLLDYTGQYWTYLDRRGHIHAISEP
jgi:hypothetical protein